MKSCNVIRSWILSLGKCFERMNKRLTTPLFLEELQTPTNSMAKGKAPRLDGMMVEFYTFF
jgi:hypothetical protein